MGKKWSTFHKYFCLFSEISKNICLNTNSFPQHKASKIIKFLHRIKHKLLDNKILNFWIKIMWKNIQMQVSNSLNLLYWKTLHFLRSNNSSPNQHKANTYFVSMISLTTQKAQDTILQPYFLSSLSLLILNLFKMINFPISKFFLWKNISFMDFKKITPSKIHKF